MDSRDDENERIRQLTEQNRQQAARIQQLEGELERLKQLLAGKADSKAAKKPVFKENYSLGRNARRKRKRQGRQSSGRRPKELKREMVRSEYDVYHADADLQQCVFRREQFAWRLIDGQAVYVGYRIHDLPDSKQLPLPPGLRTSRSEYGLEIILILAFLHYWVGVSLDHACEVMRFFTKLELSKSQADSLLKQLATDGDEQDDTIIELIALQMIVYIDETGWKVGTKSCYTWVFSTTMHVLFRCGVSRAKTEAAAVLGDSFAGIGVTDDYAAYKSLFTQHQLCWAHLIRKAIKLALQHPDHPEYATFLDELCATYHQALRHQRDGRLSVGRAEKAKQLLDRICQLCARHGEQIVPRLVELARGADLLVHDAQYTAEELQKRRGWGHSSFDQAMQLAEMAGVKRLALTHHDPEHDDEFLERIEKLCRERFSNTVLAREGMEIPISEAPGIMPRSPGRLSRRTRLTSSPRK